MLKAVLFDLDGTLLPMDLDEFLRGYLDLLAKKMAPYGYEPKKLQRAVWAGTEAMAASDGSRLNIDVFWDRFSDFYGEISPEHMALFNEFYAVEFQGARSLCGFDPEAKRAVEAARELGLRLVCATTPFYPAVATESRVRWAGLEPSDFELISTYENSRFSKPRLEYYSELLEKLGLSAGECLMVGNDTREDMCAEELGMPVFLVTPCLINRDGHDISRWPQGRLKNLEAYIKKLMTTSM